MSAFEKLLAVQSELKAPKGQFNKFGNYKYRSCEDILEAVKPLNKKHNATLYITDELQLIGERYYIKATVHFVDNETNHEITASAFAREEETKKGMDGSQITGASSSYARKYALNGLYNIDDTKDSDTTNTGDKNTTKSETNITYEDALKLTINFGTHNGRTLAEIYKADRKYIDYLANNADKNIKDAISVIEKEIKIAQWQKQGNKDDVES